MRSDRSAGEQGVEVDVVRAATGITEKPRSLGSGGVGDGYFTAEAFDASGDLKFVEVGHNQIKDVGAKLLLDVMFRGTAASGTWYIGLITAAGSIQTATDTMSSHAGWSENSSYDEATRVAWVEGAASGSSGVISIASSSTSDFTISATVSIDSIFVVDNSTKGGTTGTIWSTAPFSTSQSLVDNDVLKVSYTFTFTVTGT